MKQYTMLLVGQMFFPPSKPLWLILFKKKHTSTLDASSMLQPKQMPWQWRCKKRFHMGRLHPIMEVWGASSHNHGSNNYRPSASGAAQYSNHNCIVVVGNISFEIVITWCKSLWSAPRVVTNMVVHNLVKRYTLSTSFHS